MNILHMRYALEVARTGSVNKASESLLVAQPNISRSIKELESDLGITIFERSAKGMTLTPDGEEFMVFAERILSQIEDVENKYREGTGRKVSFSAAVAGVPYITDGAAQFILSLGDVACDVRIYEAGAADALKALSESEISLALVRYLGTDRESFGAYCAEYGLLAEDVAAWDACLISREGERSDKDLSSMTHIVDSGIFSPDPKRGAKADPRRRIAVSGEALRVKLLAKIPDSYIVSSSVTHETAERYGVCVSKSSGGSICDAVVYRKGYALTERDREFIRCLKRARDRVVSEK